MCVCVCACVGWRRAVCTVHLCTQASSVAKQSLLVRVRFNNNADADYILYLLRHRQSLVRLFSAFLAVLSPNWGVAPHFDRCRVCRRMEMKQKHKSDHRYLAAIAVAPAPQTLISRRGNENEDSFGARNYSESREFVSVSDYS